jgi:RNA polymerase subunit RPABC4/transcription elongation factor Spt4
VKATKKTMNEQPCRDCGYLIDAQARGCPRCAMNVEAEAMIERFVWRRLVPGIIIVVVGAAAIIYLIR